MTTAYEAEVRVRVARVDELRARLSTLGARRAEEYAFTDDYYRPIGRPWPPERQTLRLREHAPDDAEVLFTRIELVTEGGVTFKRSALAPGKVRLHRGSAAEGRVLLGALGFLPWLRVRKLRGELIEIPGVGTIALEEIAGHGWWLEIEVGGADPRDAAAALHRHLTVLGVDPADASPLPMAALLAPVHRGRRVYFCGAIRGGRRLQARYARLISALHSAGWTVLTPHVGDPDVLSIEERPGLSGAEILRRDMTALADADLVVAEVTVPSLGVGIELATALARGVPVIALVESGTSLSALVEGDERIRLIRYESEAEAVQALVQAVSAVPV
jgi:adenylate cyclase class IV